MRNKSLIFVYSVSTLVVLQALAILLSWIVSAIFPSLNIHSLLSNEGLRWLLTSLPENVSSPWLVLLLLVFIIYGMMAFKGMFAKIIHSAQCDPKELFARRIFFFEIFVGIIICFVLAFYPHSLALGISGHLFPGPFLKMSFCVIFVTIIVACISFMFLCGLLNNAKNTEKALVFGLQKAAPLIIIYILLKELVEMFLFILL